MIGTNRQLRSLIYLHYDSEAEMAKAMGWDRQRLWKISTGRKVPNINDLAAMAAVLKCSPGDLVDIFLAKM